MVSFTRLRIHSVLWGGVASILLSFLAIFPADAYVASIKKLEQPEAFIAVSLKDKDGKIQLFEGNKHKVDVLHMWATWCIPCRKELPEVDEFAREYKEKDVYVTAVTFDMLGKLPQVEQFFKEHSIQSLPLLFEERPQIAKNIQMKALPTTLFIVDGDIVARADGAIDWKSAETKAFIVSLILQSSRSPVSAQGD